MLQNFMVTHHENRERYHEREEREAAAYARAEIGRDEKIAAFKARFGFVCEWDDHKWAYSNIDDMDEPGKCSCCGHDDGIMYAQATAYGYDY